MSLALSRSRNAEKIKHVHDAILSKITLKENFTKKI
jgi:hypothetical protein